MRLLGILLMFSMVFVSTPSLAAGGSITSIVVSGEKAEKKVRTTGDEEDLDEDGASSEASIEPVESVAEPQQIVSPREKASPAGGSVFDF